MRSIGKSFSGVTVLNGISLAVHPGEVHAVVGENGAGKSTLMKILAGLERPDAGEIWLRGRAVHFRGPHDALRAGIAMIHQELLPFLNLTVAENIFIGQEPALLEAVGWINRRALHREAARALAQLGLSIAPELPMASLRVAEMQAVEIAKALAHQAEVIIMDEPTSALSEREAAALSGKIHDLKRRGMAVIYISHKLNEVFELADRVTVLRDGARIATFPIAETQPDQLIRLMVGRELTSVSRRPAPPPADPVLSVRCLNRKGSFRNVSFDVRPGEIFGLAGLMGAGRTEVLNAIFGLAPSDSGEVRVRGRAVRIRTPRDALRAGIGLVSEDRKIHGFVPTLGVKRNLTLAALERWSPMGIIDHAAENRVADHEIRRFGIKVSHRDQLVGRLSGGNQQKVVLARAALAEPDVLLLDEPTRGIDIGAKAQVHAIIEELASSGKAVVLVSSELPELLSLSQRILVMCQGEVRAELDPQQTTAEEILKFAIPQ
jgi:inositol transport system ATP-binding protein